MNLQFTELNNEGTIYMSEHFGNLIWKEERLWGNSHYFILTKFRQGYFVEFLLMLLRGRSGLDGA